MSSPDSHLLHVFTTLMVCGLLIYIGLTAYTFLVRDRENFLVGLTMDMFSLLSFSWKTQVLVSLVFVFFGVQFYHADQPGMMKAMLISSVFVFVFHSVQPQLYEWGKRYGLS